MYSCFNLELTQLFQYHLNTFKTCNNCSNHVSLNRWNCSECRSKASSFICVRFCCPPAVMLFMKFLPQSIRLINTGCRPPRLALVLLLMWFIYVSQNNLGAQTHQTHFKVPEATKAWLLSLLTSLVSWPDSCTWTHRRLSSSFILHLPIKTTSSSLYMLSNKGKLEHTSAVKIASNWEYVRLKKLQMDLTRSHGWDIRRNP